MSKIDNVNSYVMGGGHELERLVIQARAWETCSDAILTRLGVRETWSCVDLGCGPIGILPLLARRVGRNGRVVGVERDANSVTAAREILRTADREDVELIEADAMDSGLEAGSFDLVHARFLLPHVADSQAMLDQMVLLARPGGTVLLQEPDHCSWHFYPTIAAWPRLVSLGEQAFARVGVEINIGRRTFEMLRDAGLEDVTVHASTLALQDKHPYMRMGLHALESLRPLMLKFGLTTNEELDELVRQIEAHLEHPNTWQLTFTTMQVWGRRPRTG